MTTRRRTSTPVSSTAPPSRVDAAGARIPPAPEVPDGALAPAIVADLDLVFGDLGNSVDIEAVARLGEAGDARVAWLLADLLRFSQRGLLAETAVAAFERLTGTDVVSEGVWGQVTDWLIAWDLPAPPGYVGWKRLLFEFFEPGWAPFFDDEDADIDWRWLSWGGVLIDDRPLDAVHLSCPDGCIPALDDPAVTDAAGGSWYDDDGDRVRGGGERRSACLPQEHHGSPRDGERHHRRTPDRDALLHVVWFGPGVPHR